MVERKDLNRIKIAWSRRESILPDSTYANWLAFVG
jgi:hypothetical protein